MIKCSSVSLPESQDMAGAKHWWQKSFLLLPAVLWQEHCPCTPMFMLGLPCTDLVILLERGGNQLVQQLAEDLAHEQTNRSASSTVGARFREQLRDLISRLDKCDFHPHLDDLTCYPPALVTILLQRLCDLKDSRLSPEIIRL